MKYLRVITHIFACYALILLCGCLWKAKMPQTQRELFAQARVDIEQEDFKDARKKLDYLEEKFPESEFLVNARLLSAESYYKQGLWDEAIVKYKSFIDMHPTNHYVDRAQYFVVKCYMDKMENKKELLFFKASIVDRDLAPVQDALDEIENFERLYPYSKYIDRVRDAKRRCRAMLAEQGYYIGRFYLNTDYYSAAIKRFRKVLRTFGDIPSVREKAYFYLGIAYWKWQRKEEANRVLKQFLIDYPYSPFANMAIEKIASSG